MEVRQLLAETSLSFEAAGFLVAALGSGAISLDALGRERGLSPERVGLIMLELQGAGFCYLDPALKRDERDKPWVWTKKCQPLEAELKSVK